MIIITIIVNGETSFKLKRKIIKIIVNSKIHPTYDLFDILLNTTLTNANIARKKKQSHPASLHDDYKNKRMGYNSKKQHYIPNIC